MKTLLKVNFGNRFISYIKTMYSNTQSVVINNDHISDFFPLERGVRQGCPLSAYLFILALKMLAKKRADKRVWILSTSTVLDKSQSGNISNCLH